MIYRRLRVRCRLRPRKWRRLVVTAAGLVETVAGLAEVRSAVRWVGTCGSRRSGRCC